MLDFVRFSGVYQLCNRLGKIDSGKIRKKSVARETLGKASIGAPATHQGVINGLYCG